ncbi:hypothetical protein ACHAWU_008286 [Discostella pseudostelligera]|uniref:Cell division cycle protein 123 n=1 Tax=Discostella pseudostelligera TaxID=259834 RepID=A0ABD3M4E1_9STRA
MNITSSTEIVGNSNNNNIDISVGNIHIKKRNKLRKNITIESVIIRPLPLDFIQYLLSDGVRLPDCATKVSSCMNDDNNNDDVNNSSEDENNDGEDTDDDDDDEPETKYSFPSLTQQIQSSINQLGNICMPKMNWSSPKDATWINCGSLKCSTPGDVYLLLKSSDFIVFDLEKAWEDLHVEETSEEIYVTNVDNSVVTGVSAAVNQLEHLRIDESSLASVPLSPSHECTTNNKDDSNDNVEEQHKQFRREEFEHELILRKWCNLHPSMEFRCFIYEHELVAISQRHPSKYYSHLQTPSDDSIHPSITTLHVFFHTYVRCKFARGAIHRYVLDVYIDSQERVWIVDFNVWGTRTDGLLFDWKELTMLGNQIRDTNNSSSVPMPEMRVVTKDMKSMTYDPLSSYRGPTDVMDLLGSSGDTSAPSFEEFMKQCVRPSEM